MANIDSFIDGTYGEKHVATKGVTNKEFVTQNQIDLSDITLVTADVVRCINIPKGAVVTHVGVNVRTAADPGTSLVADAGDGASTSGWIATNIDLETTGAVFSLPGDVYPALGGKLYTADDTIDLVMTLSGAAPSVGVFEVTARYYILEATQNA